MECHYYIGRVSVTRALLGRVLLTLLHSSRARWWMGKMKWDYLFRYCTMEHMQSVARYGDVEATTSRSKCERVGCHPFALHRKIENLIKQREPETHSFYTLLWYWYIITTTTTIIIFKPFSCLFIVQRFSVVSVEMRNVIKMRAFYLYFFSRFVSLDVNWKEKNIKYRFISERNDITNLRFSIKKKHHSTQDIWRERCLRRTIFPYYIIFISITAFNVWKYKNWSEIQHKHCNWVLFLTQITALSIFPL